MQWELLEVVICKIKYNVASSNINLTLKVAFSLTLTSTIELPETKRDFDF